MAKIVNDATAENAAASLRDETQTTSADPTNAGGMLGNESAGSSGAVSQASNMNVDNSMLPVEAAPKAKKVAKVTEGAAAGDERFRFVTRPGTDEQVKRKDYILELWQGTKTSNNPTGQKFSRGAIAKHLTKITGKTVPYQIVFQATKDIDGGPDVAAGGEGGSGDPVAEATGAAA